MILQQKELEFARRLGVKNQLKCANGWVYRFKQRNGLQKVNFSGEANSAPLETLEERARLCSDSVEQCSSKMAWT